MRDVKLVVDALGGDNAPEVVLEGVAQALAQDPNIQVLLTGPADVVEPFAARHERVEPVACTQVIEMGEHPAKAVRKKKDSSIVVGCRLVKEGRAAGFFSAGSTGACMAAATLVMGRIKGIKRPALTTVIPSPAAQTVLCDIGANADCKPDYLVQFAFMGRVYAQTVLGIAEPSVGLLNIGEEETKGSEFAQKCHELMKKRVPGFAGNAEGKNIALGGFDVIVTDGFTGNVALKAFEGVGKALLGGLKDALMSSTKAKVGAALAKGAITQMKEKVSPDTYGGAQLLGVKGVCLIGHGSSSAEAIKNGVLTTAAAIRQDMPGKLEAAIRGDEAALAAQEQELSAEAEPAAHDGAALADGETDVSASTKEAVPAQAAGLEGGE